MKIRKSTKAKVQPTADFSKKKSKVGRKVKRENVTKISLKSKAIHMPTQAIQRRNVLLEEDEDHSTSAKSSVSSISRDVVNHLVKELHHYSSPNRLRALSELSNLLATRADADQWISILIPEVIELLLDIEREPRLAVIDIFKVIIQRYKLPALRNIAPVVMKYICSGLSNIHKGVRKQALMLLCVIAQEGKSQQLSGGQLIQAYLRSISDILISLLTESLTASFTPTSLDVSKNVSGEGKNMETLFSLLLKTLSVVLQTGARSSIALLPSQADSRHYSVEIDMFRAEHPSTGVLFAHADFHRSTWLKSADLISEIDPSSISSSTISQLYKHMTAILSGVIVDSNLLTVDNMAVLGQVLEITLLLVRGYWHSSIEGLIDFICSAFAQFPFACLESSLAEPGSQTELRGKRAASKLNSAICELIFAIPLATLNDAVSVVYYSDRDKDQILDKLDVSADYCVNELQQLVHRFETLLLDKTTTITDHTLDTEIVSKLFLCLTVMLTTECPVDFENILSRYRDFQLSIVKPISISNVKASAPEKLLRKAIACIHGPMCSSICEIIRRASAVDHLAQKYFGSSGPFCLLYECAVTMLKSSALKQYSHLVESNSAISLASAVDSAGGSVHSSKSAHYTDEQRAIGSLIESVHILLVRKCSSTVIPTYMAQSLSETIQLFFISTPTNCSLYDNMYDSDVYRLLDIYYYASSTSGEDLMTLSKALLTALANSHVSLDHQRYFLRLLFERRKELELDDFMSILISSVTRHCLSCAESVAKTEEEAGAQNNSNSRVLVQPFIREISSVFIWSASSEAPQNLLQLLLPVWSEVVDTVVSSANGQSISFCFAQGDDTATETQTRLYYCYNVCVAMLILAEPWLVSMGRSLERGKGTDDDQARAFRDESMAVIQLCDMVSRVCVAVLVHFRDFRIVESALQSALLKPLANILSLSNGLDFIVLESFLAHLSTVDGVIAELGYVERSSSSSSSGGGGSVLSVLQNALHVMNHLFIEIRNALNSVAFSMKKNSYSPLCENADAIKTMLEAFRLETPY